MKRTLTALTVATSLMASGASAYDPEDLQKLLYANECVGCDLSKVYLSGADLNWADLRGAILIGANLSWADLSGAILNKANLSEANLSGANLWTANLSGDAS